MISIIIVNYHVKKELFVCIKSIYESRPKTNFEIIVVDNDEIKTIEKDLKKKFPDVRYLPNKNQGFGQGNNTGARVAKGNYFFFLNPDTKVYPRTIDGLINYLNKQKKVAIAAPLLYDNNNKLYPQGANELTPLAAVFTFSFIHKLFPKNPIAEKYWMHGEWDRKTPKEVASIPGTAFVIKKKVYEQIKGFDEKFFMYFEEHDLCRRVRNLGWKIVMYPPAKVYHALGQSSKQVKNINKIFVQSRFYYLRKNFGLLKALAAESILRCSKYTVMLFGIICLASAVMTYRLAEFMPFIGDQGWFYLSARDMVTTGSVPLVGIASSHPWLHQGALWTYMLAGALFVSQFNPMGGAYLSVTLSIFTILLLYFVASNIFSRQVGIIAALLYATSPLVIQYARMPYHTSPIPLFTVIYLFALYKWLQGKPKYFPLIVFTLAVLYNLQIATFLLTVVLLIICGYGIVRKKEWFIRTCNRKIIAASIIAFILPMLPMLMYDINHGFPQTVLFLAWLGYKVATLFGYPALNADLGSPDIKSVGIFIADQYKMLVYAADSLVAFTIAVFSLGFFFKETFTRLRLKEQVSAYCIVGLIFSVSIIGIFATKTTSAAYLPILYPIIILITAIFFFKLIINRPILKPLVICTLVLLVFMNITTLLVNNYFSGKGGGLAEKVKVVKKIITMTDGKKYTMIGKGEGSQFESFTMNYEYLAWWLGHAPSKDKQPLRIVIQETPNGIKITKEQK